MAGYGGETPFPFGLTLTVESPTGTNETTPVEAGDLFKLGGTAFDGSGYKAAALVDGNDATSSVLLLAHNRMTTVGTLGVTVLGRWHLVRKLGYVTGVAPTIGQSVEASGVNVRRIKGKAFDGDGYVLNVDTTALLAEVLI